MAVDPTLQQAMTQLDDATNKIADTVHGLDALIDANMSPADVQTVHDTLGQIEARLRGLAADPRVPVPPAPGPLPTTFKKKP